MRDENLKMWRCGNVEMPAPAAVRGVEINSRETLWLEGWMSISPEVRKSERPEENTNGELGVGSL